MKTSDLPLVSPGTMSSAVDWKTTSRPVGDGPFVSFGAYSS
ncbi:hypothetical protein AB0I98_13775 [Streptomyces sp. NPDC050211]